MNSKHSIIFRELQDEFRQQIEILQSRRSSDSYHSSQDDRGYAMAAIELRNLAEKQGWFFDLWTTCSSQKPKDEDVQRLFASSALLEIDSRREEYINACTISPNWMNRRIEKGETLNDFEIATSLTHAREMGLALTGIRDSFFSFLKEIYPDIAESTKLSTTQEIQSGERLTFMDNTGKRIALVTGKKAAAIEQMGGLPLVLLQDMESYRANVVAPNRWSRLVVFHLGPNQPQFTRRITTSHMDIEGWGMLPGEKSISSMRDLTMSSFGIWVQIQGRNTSTESLDASEINSNEVLDLLRQYDAEFASRVEFTSSIKIYPGGENWDKSLHKITAQFDIWADDLDMARHLARDVIDMICEKLSVKKYNHQIFNGIAPEMEVNSSDADALFPIPRP